MQIDSIAALIDPVKQAGAMALEEQRRVAMVERSYKQDGSVLTEVDQKVEDYLVSHMLARYPQANIVAEETSRPYDPGRAYTFAVDPIDGTDVFSLGMPGWCLSVGLLDEKLQPVAGILYGPAWNLLAFADVGQPARCDGLEIVPDRPVDLDSSASSLMVASRIHRELDLGGYPGKMRSIGSAALHIAFPLLYQTVDGALLDAGIHIWDLAGAHAILRSHGLRVEQLAGGPIDYGRLLDGRSVGQTVVAGTSEVLEGLRRLLIPR
jgi:myo-inositol-1(or 4)-monophosphatase